MQDNRGMRTRTPAICIRTTDYSETSQVLHFVTRLAGVVSVLGKGLKRPKSKSGGALDLLNEGDLVYSPGRGEALGTLIEFSESVVHLGLRKSADRLNPSLYMIELVAAMLAEDDPHPEVFDLLHSALGRLDAADSDPSAVLAYFQWRLLQHVGLLGEWNHCASCGEAMKDLAAGGNGGMHFSSTLGGLLCGRCEMIEATRERVPVDGATLAGLAALVAAAAGKKVKLPVAQSQAINRLLAYHITHQLGRRLRMMRYVIAR